MCFESCLTQFELRNDHVSMPNSRRKDLQRHGNTYIRTTIRYFLLVNAVVATFYSFPTHVAFSSLSNYHCSHHARYNKVSNTIFESVQKDFLFSSCKRHKKLVTRRVTHIYLLPTKEDTANKDKNIAEINHDSYSSFSLFDPIASKTTEVLEAVIINPAQGVLDNATDGWALSYADLSPDNAQTLAGQTFLASNMAYVVAGALLTITGDFWFGFCTELAAVASFNYHYQQLMNSGSTSSKTVRLALLVDYLFAMVSILTGLVYILTSPSTAGLPIYAVSIGAIACVCLGLSWVWEYGKPYMFWHSLWHLFSAYAGYVIGSEHFRTNLPT
jgi:hypothetical protein